MCERTATYCQMRRKLNYYISSEDNSFTAGQEISNIIQCPKLEYISLNLEHICVSFIVSHLHYVSRDTRCYTHTHTMVSA